MRHVSRDGHLVTRACSSGRRRERARWCHAVVGGQVSDADFRTDVRINRPVEQLDKLPHNRWVNQPDRVDAVGARIKVAPCAVNDLGCCPWALVEVSVDASVDHDVYTRSCPGGPNPRESLSHLAGVEQSSGAGVV
jgi:hypothetical protein